MPNAAYFTNATTSTMPIGQTFVTSTTSTTSNLVWVSTSNSTIPTPVFSNQVNCRPDQMVYVPYTPDKIDLAVGHARTIHFPDGTWIDFEVSGSFRIFDKDAKVIYKAARCRDFNPFINASDKLEEFIKFCGTIGIRADDMLGIPIQSFIQWLVIEAARADGEFLAHSPTALLPYYSKPRCRSCGRFMSPQLKADGIEFCRPECLAVKLNSHRSQSNGKASSETNAYQSATKSSASF
jgi:hypothetical protein